MPPGRRSVVCNHLSLIWTAPAERSADGALDSRDERYTLAKSCTGAAMKPKRSRRFALPPQSITLPAGTCLVTGISLVLGYWCLVLSLTVLQRFGRTFDDEPAKNRPTSTNMKKLWPLAAILAFLPAAIGGPSPQHLTLKKGDHIAIIGNALPDQIGRAHV